MIRCIVTPLSLHSEEPALTGPRYLTTTKTQIAYDPLVLGRRYDDYKSLPIAADIPRGAGIRSCSEQKLRCSGLKARRSGHVHTHRERVRHIALPVVELLPIGSP